MTCTQLHLFVHLGFFGPVRSSLGMISVRKYKGKLPISSCVISSQPFASKSKFSLLILRRGAAFILQQLEVCLHLRCCCRLKLNACTRALGKHFMWNSESFCLHPDAFVPDVLRNPKGSSQLNLLQHPFRRYACLSPQKKAGEKKKGQSDAFTSARLAEGAVRRLM